MSTEKEPLVLLDEEGEVRFLTEEDLDSVQAISEAVSMAVASSPWPDMDPEGRLRRRKETHEVTLK